VAGGLLWVISLTLTGYLFGNTAWVQANLSKIIWAMIFIPGLLAMWGAWRAQKK
jgi:membrane-associated protein